ATSVLTSLSIATAAGAQFNVRNDSLIVNGGANPTATRDQIRSYLISGRGVPVGGAADGTWTGAGITSSTAANDFVVNGREQTVVAYALNSQLPLGSYTSFGGQTVSANDILIRYTRNGDANLDGKTGNADVTILGGTFDGGASTGHEWCQGDFNWDGKIDNSDVTVLGAMYNESGPLAPAMLSAEFGKPFASALEAGMESAGAGVVPEPS